jgi:hypothetical protein
MLRKWGCFQIEWNSRSLSRLSPRNNNIKCRNLQNNFLYSHKMEFRKMKTWTNFCLFFPPLLLRLCPIWTELVYCGWMEPVDVFRQKLHDATENCCKSFAETQPLEHAALIKTIMKQEFRWLSFFWGLLRKKRHFRIYHPVYAAYLFILNAFLFVNSPWSIRVFK